MSEQDEHPEPDTVCFLGPRGVGVNEPIRRKARELTTALAKAVLANEALEEAMDEELEDEKVGPGWSNTIQDMEALQTELDDLRAVHNKLVCSYFPGEVELVTKRQDGTIGKASVKDLRSLCRANGIVCLDDGQFICGNCKGIRIAEICGWCEELEDEKNDKETMMYEVKRSEDEINDVLNKCDDREDSGGSGWLGMSYEQGVAYAIRWITGQTEDNPMDD